MGDQAAVKRDLGPLRFFNAGNPTGHYSLNLACATDHAVAQQLLDLNVREMADALYNLKKFEGCLRNVTLQTEAIDDFDPLTYRVQSAHTPLTAFSFFVHHIHTPSSPPGRTL